ncbi:MAG TPA: hypothetical protein VJT73_07095 [Polyangiaceae bacterium]|nr:hypothetical protein [Polyangiaceae bacterium]
MKTGLLGFCLLLGATSLSWACKHNEGDSVVVTGDGLRLSSEAIDHDPLALLPANPVAMAWIDAQAFFNSSLGGEVNRLAAKYVPIGVEAGFVPRRDMKKIVGGVYSLAGADVVAVVQGDFNVEMIGAAADRHAVTPGGVPLVHSKYAGNEVYTAGNVGFSVVTKHTMLVGNETGMRRALDRVRDNRLKREIPEWMTKLMENPQASMVLLGDVTGQPQVAALAKMAPFVNGLSNFRILGNFQPPGVNLAGTLTYPDAASATQGATNLQNLGQMAGLLNMLAIFGLASPLQNLQVQSQDNSATFVTAIDGQSLSRLLARVL